jgi:Ni/Co efflux regulator RcnB
MTNPVNLQNLFDQQSVEHPNSYLVPNDESRARMSEAAKQRKHSDETRAKMRDAHLGKRTKGMTGQTHTIETRAKMREARLKNNWIKGQKLSDEIRANMVKAAAIRREKYAKAVMTPHGYFPHVLAVAEAAGVGKAAVYQWIKKYPEHYYYMEKCGE